MTSRGRAPYNRGVARRLLLVLALPALALAADAADGSGARRAVEAFVARLGGAGITDLTIRQTLTIYDPGGRQPASTVEQVLSVKLPRRQRLEQVVEGQREVRLIVDERAWVRRADGRTYEVPRDPARERTHLLTPLTRTALDLLAEWKALGVRDDVSHETRVRGRPVTVIGVGPNDHEHPAVWLDGEYGVIRVVTRERLPQGEALVDLALSEHRPLQGGFYFPYRQELFADSKLLFLVTVRSVAVNTNPPDALFDPEALGRER